MAETLSLVFHVEPEVPIPQWMDENRVLIGGDMPGRWETRNVPALRRMLEICGLADVRVVTIVKPAQCGITELFIGIVLWSMDVRPGRWMIMLPKAEKAEDFNKTRFQPALKACAKSMRHVGNEKRAFSASRTVYDRGIIEWIGSNSESGTEGTPARYVWIDEYDRCDPLATSKLLERGKTFADSKVIETGTPGDAGKGIDARRLAATCQFVWYVPCPHCRKYHSRNWRQVRWANRGDADPTIVRRTAWYECPACAGKCAASDRAWQGRLGQWVAQGQSISALSKDEHGHDKPGEISGTLPPIDHVSFAILGIDNDLLPNPYGEVAAAFLEKIKAHGQVDYVWCTETLGEAFMVKGSKLEAAELEARARQSPNARGRCPVGTVGTLLSCDVQTDRMYWALFAFSNRGKDIWLVDWGCEDCLGDGTLALALDEVRKRQWPMTVPSMKDRMLSPALVVVDTGHRTDTLYRYRKDRDERTILVKGKATRGNKDTRLYSKSMQKCGDGEIPLYLVNVTMWKNSMARWLSNSSAEHALGIVSLTDGTDAGVVSTWHLPKDADAGLIGQLCSEQYLNGLWDVRRKGTPNHFWDIFVYAAAMLERFGVREINVSTGATNGKAEQTTGGRVKPPGTRDDGRVGERPRVGQRYLD